MVGIDWRELVTAPRGYGCSIAQLVIGLAPTMGWRRIPDRDDQQALARFVKRHRKSVQR
jgi:hypothetical protein